MLHSLCILIRRKFFPPDLSPDRYKQLRELEKKIGVIFNNLNYLEQALKHRSYVYNQGQLGIASNERMEFLGDAVLDLVVCEHLYNIFPNKREGKLTKKKSLLVSRSVLAQKSSDLGLGDYILMSNNESLSGGRNRNSILADIFEAIIAAIYLDRGLSYAQRFIKHYLLEDFEKILNTEDYINFKNKLQELIQKNYNLYPEYHLVKEIGPPHNKTFIIEVWIGKKRLGSGTGSTKKEAEQKAAQDTLALLEQNHQLFPKLFT